MAIHPKGYEIRALRRRHGITQRELADSLYDATEAAVRDWEHDRRKLKPMIWWAMVLTWDKIDLWADEKEWLRRFRGKETT